MGKIINYRMYGVARSCDSQMLPEQQNFYGDLHCEQNKIEM